MTRKEKAMAYFRQGYNSAQAVVLAFADLTDMDEEDIENLLIQQIEFCNTIVINKVLKRKFTVEDINKLDRYIRNNGKIR